MKGSRWLDVFRLRLRSLFRRREVERELQKELRFHIEQEIEDGCAHGLSPEQASAAAWRAIGGMAQIQEECRDMRRTNFIDRCIQDLRYATRMLANSPGFAAVMILSLGLSIGATSAMVSVAEGVLVRPLPFRDPGRLVRVFTSNPGWPKFPINPNDFRDFRARLHSFESFAAYTHRDLQLSGTGEAFRLPSFAVTAGFFHVLGLSPATRSGVRGSEHAPMCWGKK